MSMRKVGGAPSTRASALASLIGVAAAFACSSGDERAPGTPTHARAATDSKAAHELIAATVSRFENVAKVLPSSVATGFTRDGGFWTPTLKPGAVRRATVRLPTLGSDAFSVRDEASGLSVEVALEGADPVTAEIADGYVVYPGQLATTLAGLGARGGHVFHRVGPRGTEDYITYDTAPATPSLRYAVTLGSKVAGLRQVGNVVEFVDRDHSPRLRVESPYLIDSVGTRHEAALSIEGCAYDANPASPWGRPVVPPGATRCHVVVDWKDRAVRYPAVLDPAWTTTDSMATARGYHTANLVIANGQERVLVVGGQSSNTTFLSTAELYNPTTETWATTGSMTGRKSRHTGTELTEPPANNGLVMVAGGRFSSTGVSSTIRTYDPATGMFTNRGNLDTERRDHTATLLSTGFVLIAGGSTGSNRNTSVSTAELYNVSTHGVALTDSMAAPRRKHVAIRFIEGATLSGVIVAGGENGSALSLSTADRFDHLPTIPSENFQPAPPMSETRVNFAGIRLSGNDGVLVIDGGPNQDSEIFRAGNWFDASDMPGVHYDPVMALLPNGWVFVTGDGGAVAHSASLFDPSTDQWFPGGNPTYEHGNGSATTMSNGKVLVAGAQFGSTGYRAESELYELVDDGGACGVDEECVSRNCVDGVCCNTPCTGFCNACSASKKNQGADGVCGPIASGSDPDTECSDDGAASCGMNGFCDGAGACELYAAGTSCGTTICSGDTLTQFACNGFGQCNQTLTPCDPYVCEANACRTGCSDNSHCVASSFCDSGGCVAQNPNGTPCNNGSECASTFCVDGVCCDSACTSPCQACAAAEKQGGVDGECGPAAAGRDPHNDCPDEGSTSCQRDGSCDGAGACRLYPEGVGCGATMCQGNTVTGFICNGMGTCVNDSTGVMCAPYLCQAGGCSTSCQTDAECLGDFWCNAFLCEPKGQLGETCTSASGCLSNFCVDGVCCETECSGQCEACDVAGSEGSCEAVTGDPHGTRPGCDSPDPACVGACNGANRQTCTFPGDETLCGDTRCDGNVLEASRCDGQGACVEDTPQDCGNYACNAEGTACNTSCSSDDDCSAGSLCATTTGECGEGGFTCKDDFTVEETDGTEVDCSPYRCEAGSCLESCTASADCAGGYTCDEARCVRAADDAAEDDGGCGCRAAGGNRDGGLFSIVLAVGALLAQRRRRQRQRLV